MGDNHEIIDFMQSVLSFYMDESDSQIAGILKQMHQSLEGMKQCAL